MFMKNKVVDSQNKVADWIASIKQKFRYIRRTTSSEKFLMHLQPRPMARKPFFNSFLAIL
jgi:hypothetical protein